MLKSFCQYFFNFSSTSKSRTPIHSYRQDEEDGQNRFSNFIFFLFWNLILKNMPSSILVLHRKQAHQRIHHIETNKIFIIIFNECSEFHFCSVLKSKIRKKHVFLIGLCRRVFVNTSSILALHPNQAHQYIRIVKTNRMVKADFRISFFFLFLNLI